MTRYRIITVLIIAGFVGFLVWSTIKAQEVECHVCVNFNGKENCALATGSSEREAAETAQSTACGPLTSGMNDAIACGRIEPTVRQCRTK